MVADYYTKPLQGKLFHKFRDQILGLVPMGNIEAHGNHRSVLDNQLQNNEKNVDNGNIVKNPKEKSWADVVKGTN